MANPVGMQDHASTKRRTRAMDEAGKLGNAQNVAGQAEVSSPQRRVFISCASHDAPLAQKACSTTTVGPHLPNDTADGCVPADFPHSAVGGHPLLRLW
jgi:hypothetical protein